jgi:hypothetical protein
LVDSLTTLLMKLHLQPPVHCAMASHSIDSNGHDIRALVPGKTPYFAPAIGAKVPDQSWRQRDLPLERPGACTDKKAKIQTDIRVWHHARAGDVTVILTVQLNREKPDSAI